jgi:hypothetical protein
MWFHNVGIAITVLCACEFVGFKPTREQENRRSLPASGCSIVKEALDRNGDHKSESTVQNIYLGAAGDLARIWGGEGTAAAHAHVRADLTRIWPQLAQGPARLTRIT